LFSPYHDFILGLTKSVSALQQIADFRYLPHCPPLNNKHTRHWVYLAEATALHILRNINSKSEGDRTIPPLPAAGAARHNFFLYSQKLKNGIAKNFS
jgi:hypothetical protein